jgi:MOSC domain-containing protein YiiM
MRILSVNVGRPRQVEWKGKTVSTGIFKAPVQGRVALRTLNLDGDRQADLRVHGGPHKAVYVYPSEHYEFWRRELPGMELPWGMFGENLTTEGLLEKDVHVGDLLLVGTTEVVVTQPRMPCYKLGVKFGDDEIIRMFHESRRSGFYLAVAKEGELSAGDSIEILRRDARGVSIADFYRVFATHEANDDLLRRILRIPALPASWHHLFKELLGESPSA